MKSRRILINFILLFFIVYGCNNELTENSPENQKSIELDLGNDTSIVCNESIILDAGSGFETYQWNDIYACNTQTFEVLIPGIYWVTVTDSFGNEGSDTIQIGMETYQPINPGCTDPKEFIFNNTYTIFVPCNFLVSNCSGIDSYWWEVRSPEQEIVFQYESYLTEKNDTLFAIPDAFYTDHMESIIYNDENIEVGRSFTHNINSTFRNKEGFFLFKQDEFYLKIFRLSYSDSAEGTVNELL